MQDMVTAILQGDTYILDNLGAKFYADNGLIRDTLICLVRAMARECGALREEVRAVPPAEGRPGVAGVPAIRAFDIFMS